MTKVKSKRKKEDVKAGMLSGSLLTQYNKTVSENEGKWFALKPDGELIAVAKDSRKLWKKIHRKLSKNVIEEIDLIIGYSQTKKEREMVCLLPLVSMNVT